MPNIKQQGKGTTLLYLCAARIVSDYIRMKLPALQGHERAKIYARSQSKGVRIGYDIIGVPLRHIVNFLIILHPCNPAHP